MKYTFPRENRLVTETQFKHVFNKTQQKITTKPFAIYCCYNTCGYPRLGIIVPKRNVKQASQRNFFKRIIREHFRLNQNEIKKVDIVIFVSRDGGKVTKKELNLCLAEQFKKMKP